MTELLAFAAGWLGAWVTYGWFDDWLSAEPEHDPYAEPH